MSKRFRITASEGISVVLEFNGDEVHIIASFSSNSTMVKPQVKEDDEVVSSVFQKGKTTDLSEEQVASICEEYATTSIHDLSKKYHISQKRLYSILNEHGIQIRKHGQHSATSKKMAAKAYNLEKVDNIIEKREVSQLRMLYYAINKTNGTITAEELVKDHKFPIEFLEFATSKFESFTQKFILKMYKMGYSIDAIATRVKKPTNQIRQLIPDSMIRSRGDKSNSILTGEKLKDTEKQAIRNGYINGENINELADRFGVSLQTVKRYAL